MCVCTDSLCFYHTLLKSPKSDAAAAQTDLSLNLKYIYFRTLNNQKMEILYGRIALLSLKLGSRAVLLWPWSWTCFQLCYVFHLQPQTIDGPAAPCIEWESTRSSREFPALPALFASSACGNKKKNSKLVRIWHAPQYPRFWSSQPSSDCELRSPGLLQMSQTILSLL